LAGLEIYNGKNLTGKPSYFRFKGRAELRFIKEMF
jgi:hypothetical protein